MVIEHVAMYVNDLEKTRDFFVDFLQIARSDRQPQCEKECMEYIEKHLRHFCKVYMR